MPVIPYNLKGTKNLSRKFSENAITVLPLAQKSFNVFFAVPYRSNTSRPRFEKSRGNLKISIKRVTQISVIEEKGV